MRPLAFALTLTMLPALAAAQPPRRPPPTPQSQAAKAAQAEQAAQAKRIAEGHELALELCSVCHVAAPDQQGAPVMSSPGPPFHDIANRPDVTAASLRTFLTTTHSSTRPPFTMPNPHLTERQLEDMVAYILSMRDPS
jgi:mono/diheme cytochrome c family protein